MLQTVSLAHVPLSNTAPATSPASTRPVGFVEGTLIDTPQGRVRVETLLAGDLILTAEGETVELRATSVLQAASVEMVRFPRHSFGNLAHRPRHDLLLPAHHPVRMEDWRAQVVYGVETLLTAASSLVDDVFITRETVTNQRLRRLHFDKPRVILADGIAVGTARERAPLPPQISDEHALRH